MTTKTARPVYRETFERVRDRGAKYREVIVGIMPGDVLSLRLKGTRYGCEIAIASVWTEAMRRKALALAAQRRAERKQKRGKP